MTIDRHNHQPHDPPLRRPRRLRRTAAIRRMVCETRLSPQQLVLPLFVIEGQNIEQPINSMPGCARMSIDRIITQTKEALELDIGGIALFPYIDNKLKTPDGCESLNPDNLLCRAIRSLKQAYPSACIITDVALDPYATTGHDGIVGPDGTILNDQTVAILAKMAVVQAQAGADMVAPSDMMDGRVVAIRQALDQAELTQTAILSYTAKYASSFYGPFRDALDSAPAKTPGVPQDKFGYQMNPANAREAIVEAMLDEAEGADIIMVKPAIHYLDVISILRARTALPIAAYHVSGEYAMLKAAAERGWVDERKGMTEALTAMARAGADIIFTYAALDYARWRKESAC